MVQKSSWSRFSDLSFAHPFSKWIKVFLIPVDNILLKDWEIICIILVGYWYLVPNVNRDSYFNPFQSNGLDAEDCLYEVVYPRFSIILCSIREISKCLRTNFKTEKFQEFHQVFEIFKAFRLSSQYSVIQLPFIFGIAKIKNIMIACLIITNHFRHGSKTFWSNKSYLQHEKYI